MMKSILPAALLSLAVVSASWALPVPPSGAIAPLNSTDLIQVKKGGGKHHGGKHHGKHHGGKHAHHGKGYHYRYKYGHPWRGYYHGGRYWGHKYVVRPANWVVLGCVNVGPFWYCP